MIYEAMVDRFGGEKGYYNETDNRIKSLLALQYPFFGIDKYPGVFKKAAMLWYFFTKGHCFIDGNKRVGMQAAIVFLEINGYEDKIDDEEGYLKTVEIAESRVPEEERDEYINHLTKWLDNRFEK